MPKQISTATIFPPPKEIRKAAHLPLIAVAVGARVSETTARVYEADRASVNEESRSRLDAYYADLRSRLGSPSEPHHAA